MKEEINSMEHNGVWDLVELSKGCKRVVLHPSTPDTIVWKGEKFESYSAKAAYV